MQTTAAAQAKPTAAQQYAAARAADVVPNVLGAITQIRKQSKRIAWCALAAITPHAIVFLATHGEHGGNLPLTLFAWFTAALVCITIDLGMVTMLSVVQTRGVRSPARNVALGVLVFLMLVSGTIQVLAPGFLLIRVLLGTTVLILVLVEVVASLIDVDPELLRQIEADAIAIAPPAEPAPPAKAAGRKCPAGCKCGKHRKAAAPAKTTRKASATRATRATQVKVPATPAALLAVQDENAPVSPAGHALVSPGGILIARTLAEAIEAA